ncbi:hypothetical protein [Moorena sp. SIO3H5]|uniref:hypothetical protein n=1 Tax=Moorena sp. SIO3H5 TaxID=2607834 RepID=UPI0013B60838|nr:hypothetical protein [Moorena sp. SIO3H5]NEO74391.1 hypothetical protein [Moorena sp. SIO3H5]
MPRRKQLKTRGFAVLLSEFGLSRGVAGNCSESLEHTLERVWGDGQMGRWGRFLLRVIMLT